MVTTSMIRVLEFIYAKNADPIQEGLYADQYRDPEIRLRIRQEYTARYRPAITPATNPELYDPLDPPAGWRYDPYYELWIKEN